MPPKEQMTAAAASGGYDHLLIAKAPEITKADRQEGYDINLLEQGRTSAPRNTVPPPSGSHSSIEKNGVTPLSNGYSKSKSTPWYRTTKGLVIIIVVALVIVGVVVGVAVGVTQSKKSNNSSGALRSNEAALPTSSAVTAGGIATPTASTAPSAPPAVANTGAGNRPSSNAVSPISVLPGGP